MADQKLFNNDQLFCESEDWWNNACVNFTHDGLYLYSYAYKEAADVLVESVVETGQRNDVLIHPIAFCYRHYLELSFKSILIRCSRLLDIPLTKPDGHQIEKLWPLCIPLIEQIFPGQSTGDLIEVTRLVNEFSRIDPFATAFRYPEDKKGNTSLEGISLINIRNLREVMNKIDIIIHGVLEMVHEYQSTKDDLERDY